MLISDRKHVYNDLEPYLCLFSDCEKSEQTIQSRREWIDHEFHSHRIVPQWHCNICKKIFQNKESFRGHVERIHENDFSEAQVNELVLSAKRVVPRDVGQEICPFCLTIPAQTRRGFASHVGKHQQEISLAALPSLETDKGHSDSDSDSNHDDNDSDDGSGSSNESNRTLNESTLGGDNSGDKDDFPKAEQESEQKENKSMQTSFLEMHRSIVNNDSGSLMRQLMSPDLNINNSVGEHGTILQVAALEGNVSMVQLILGKGANPNAQGGFYGSALQAAAVCGFDRVIEELLGNGADINLGGGRYGSALQAAVSNGQVSSVQLLLRHDAKTDAIAFPEEEKLQLFSEGEQNSFLEEFPLSFADSLTTSVDADENGDIIYSCRGCGDVVSIISISDLNPLTPAA